MKYLKSFSLLFESTSAGSHDRGSSEVSPFKYAINFDNRIGYTKEDFVEDLREIYLKSTRKDRSELIDFLFKNSGVLSISQILDLSQDRIDVLTKKVEEFLDSKAEYRPQRLPDGYFICYENLFKSGKRCDLYYSPSLKKIKISFTDSYPESEESIYELDDFRPEAFGIDAEEFNNLISKLNN